MTITPPTAPRLRSRIIEPSQFVADKSAFVDVKIERSVGKASYSFIGPGVSQNAAQSINLVEPHGFNVGAASMPHGVTNNPHLHYTVELFLCTSGEWRFEIGEHAEQTLTVRAGDVFSAPPWIFRGFTNTGPDDGWLFVVLGHDDTGGIIWAPSILEEAAQTGLYLGFDNSVIEAEDGAAPVGVIEPLTPEHLVDVDSYSDDELAACVVGRQDLDWSARGLLSSFVDGLGGEIAPVVGHGMTQDRHHRAPITTPHGFSLEWLRVAPGERTGLHRHGDTQVVFFIEGAWEVVLGDGDRNDRECETAVENSMVSVPRGAWRDFVNVGEEPALAVVVNGSDAPTVIEWHAEVLAAAEAAGWGLDAAGTTAPTSLLRRPRS
ncbi:MAG: cupin domain-containing protein [Actinomycetota bacterium]